jgi:hypothetical protein
MLQAMKRWATDARVALLTRKLDEKEQELREYDELVLDLSASLKEARDAIEKADDVVGGLTESVGILQERNAANYRNYLVTLAVLVAQAGGAVNVPKELFDAVTSGPVNLDLNRNPDGSLTLTLTTPAPEASPAECAGHGCECITEDQVVS